MTSARVNPNRILRMAAWVGTALVGVTVVILLVILVVTRVFVTSATVADREQAAAVHRLSEARSVADLQSAIGGLGCVYVYPDKSWIVVWFYRWETEHPRPGEDQWRAVMLDSSGQWFQSQRNFGWFNYTPKLMADYDRILADEVARQKSGKMSYPSELRHEHMRYVLTTAASVTGVRDELVANGFVRFDPGIPSATARIPVTDADVKALKAALEANNGS